MTSPRSRRPDRTKPPVVERRRDYAVLVAHVARHPNASAHREELDEFRDLLLIEVRRRVGLVTYEEISEIVRANGLRDLADDINRRVALIPR